MAINLINIANAALNPHVDIIITERSKVSVKSISDVLKLTQKFIYIPWLPEAIEFDNGEGKFAVYDILDKGDVAVPCGVSLKRYSWEGIFPGTKRNEYSMLRGGLKLAPSHYDSILTKWKDEGTPLNLLIIGTSINADVLIDEYNGEYAGAFGDINYRISFIEDKNIVVSTTKIQAPKRSETQSGTDTYTVKKGDTLWEISEKHQGAGSKWEKIYDANKEIIEKTANQHGYSSSDHGWWIFPGTVLTLP